MTILTSRIITTHLVLVWLNWILHSSSMVYFHICPFYISNLREDFLSKWFIRLTRYVGFRRLKIDKEVPKLSTVNYFIKSIPPPELMVIHFKRILFFFKMTKIIDGRQTTFVDFKSQETKWKVITISWTMIQIKLVVQGSGHAPIIMVASWYYANSKFQTELTG